MGRSGHPIRVEESNDPAGETPPGQPAGRRRYGRDGMTLRCRLLLSGFRAMLRKTSGFQD